MSFGARSVSRSRKPRKRRVREGPGFADERVAATERRSIATLCGSASMGTLLARYQVSDTARDYIMRTSSDSRFDAQSVDRLTTVNEGRRFEMQFCDSDGKKILVSLPMRVAVEVACTICDVSEKAPFLVGGVQMKRLRAGPR
jgi:hypothetical protein